MKQSKLQLGLSLIPYLGFLVALVWGAVRLGQIKKQNALYYILLCLIPVLVIGGIAAGGCWLVFTNITRNNISLILALNACFLCVMCWLIAGACLFIQNRMTKATEQT